MRRLLRAFVMGAVLFPVWDAMHVLAGVLRYTTPSGWAWWTPLQFGVVWAFIAWCLPRIEQRLGETDSGDSSARLVLVEVLIFSLVYALTAWWPLERGPALSALLTFLLLVRLAWGAQQHDEKFVLAGFVLGPVGEALVSSTGVFHYTHPEFLGIPSWLPLLWAMGGFMARRCMRSRALGA